MTNHSPRIYVYKITFEEVPYYYYGVHKEKKFNEYYMGSPITHKWCWELYTPKKQILQLFDFSDEGWLEANEIEQRIIRPFFNDDKWCLNERCGKVVSLDILRKNGKKVGEKYSSFAGRLGGKKSYELGLGIHGRTKEQRTEDCSKGGKIMGEKHKKDGTGIFTITPEERTEIGKRMGKITYELGIGVHGRTKEQMTEDGKKGGKITAENQKKNKTGIFGINDEQKRKNSKKGGRKAAETNKNNKTGLYGLTKEQRSKTAKETSSQKWMCLETGYITNSGGLSNYQKARSIDTSKRVRIE